MTDTKAEEPTTPEKTEPETATTPEKKTNPFGRGTKKTSPLSDLTDVDLTDQDTGQPAPLSAQTENLQATVSNYSGRTLLKIAVRGYIGEEPVVILAQDVGELSDLVDQLEKAAAAQKKEFAKKK
jgi:hypothetical protein